MASVEKVSIALTPELLSTVKSAVESGEYASTSEVVREALRQWTLRKPLREAEIDRLRAAWKAGVESGPSEPLDLDTFKRSMHRKLAESKAG